MDISSPINLYCNESAGDALSSDAGVSDIGNLSTDFPIDDESSIVSVFDSELDQMLEPQLVTRFLELPEVVTAYQDAVNWMLKVPTIVYSLSSSPLPHSLVLFGFICARVIFSV